MCARAWGGAAGETLRSERGGWKARQGGASKASQGEPSAMVHSAPAIV